MADIQILNLAGIDLNLLAAFEALMAERNVTRAAEHMGLTQSAMSNTLARLRCLLADPVLVRTAGGMRPTDRAIELIEPVGAALRGIRRALAPRDRFIPSRSGQRFRIITADLNELMLLPPLVRRLGREAPGVDLEVTHVGSGFPAEELRSGQADLAIGTFNVPDGFVARKVLDEDFVCIVRRNHPRVRSRLTLRRFTELGHVLVSPFGGRGGMVDQALVAQGRVRRVAIQTRHFLIAPLLVAQSDLVATVPRRLAERFATLLPLRILRPPIRLAGFAVKMVWHGRTADDAGQQWFRQLLVEIAARL
jgi:DNA-binding transcriptional LysR family regulator